MIIDLVIVGLQLQAIYSFGRWQSCADLFYDFTAESRVEFSPGQSRGYNCTGIDCALKGQVKKWEHFLLWQSLPLGLC